MYLRSGLRRFRGLRRDPVPRQSLREPASMGADLGSCRSLNHTGRVGGALEYHPIPVTSRMAAPARGWWGAPRALQELASADVFQ